MKISTTTTQSIGNVDRKLDDKIPFKITVIFKEISIENPRLREKKNSSILVCPTTDGTIIRESSVKVRFADLLSDGIILITWVVEVRRG